MNTLFLLAALESHNVEVEYQCCCYCGSVVPGWLPVRLTDYGTFSVYPAGCLAPAAAGRKHIEIEM